MKRSLPLTIFRILAVVLCAGALIGAFDLFSVGRQVCLFANWSCLLSLITWLLLAWKPERFASLQGMATMCGLLTMILFHFALPLYTAMPRNNYQRIVDTLIRTIIPMLMAADFLLLRPRGKLRKHAPLLWTLFPIGWFLLSLMLPMLSKHVWSALPEYPYFFLTPGSRWILPSPQGYLGVLLNAAAILVVYVVAGYMVHGAYRRQLYGLSCYRLLAALLCLYGQLVSFGILSGRFNGDAACYFTNLSNILCLVTWLLLLWKPTGFGRLHGLTAQAILLTMIVYHTVLSGFDFRLHSISQFNNHTVHTFVPLLMVTDFLFLRRRVRMRWYTPFVWVLAPVVYLGFVLLMPTLEASLFPGMTKYPYFFVNPMSGWLLPAPQGSIGVFANCLVIAAAYIGTGYIMSGLHALVGRVKHGKMAA